MLKIISLLLLSSCATNSLNTRLKKGEISIGPLLDLSRSSYLKGCTDNSSKKFEQCVIKAKEHEREIKEILTQ
jgi:hypothetical protein